MDEAKLAMLVKQIVDLGPTRVVVNIDVSEADKLETDWEEYDPRDDDEGSLFMFND